MVDFTRAQIQTGVASPHSPSVPNAGPSALSSVVSTVAGFIPSKQELDARANRKREATASRVTELYSQEMLRLADAVDLGEMSSGVARARARRLYSSYIADNPGLQKELYDVHNRVISTAGLGEVIDEGTEEEQREAAFRKKVADAGFITSGMSEEEQQQAVDQYRSFETGKYLLEIETQKMAYANSELENISKRIGIERGRIGLQNDKIGLQRSQIGLGNDQIERQTKILGLQKAQSEHMARQAMHQMSQSFTPVFQRNVNQLIEDLGPNPTPEQRAQAQSAINDLWSQTYGGVMAGLGPGASSDQVAMVTRPMQDWMNKALEVVDGKRELANLQTQTDLVVQRQALSMLGDPELEAAAGLRSVLGENIALSDKVTAAGVKAFQRSLEGAPPAPTSPDFPEFMEMSVTLLEAAGNDNMEMPESIQEAQTNLNNLLGSIGSLRNPSAQELDVAAENLSSPQFGTYVRRYGLEGFDGEARQGALTTFSEFYVQEVVPLIREEWQKADLSNPAVSMPGSTPRVQRMAPENIRVDFSGTGVGFVPTSGSDGLVSNHARNLNDQVAPVLNKIVRLGAHLEGHTDYRAFFEQNYRELFETDVIRGEDGSTD